MSKKKITFKQFWELTEIYTAPLNLFIILLGISAAYFLGGARLSWQLLDFVAIIIFFHLAVNVFNHYMDYLNAEDENYKTQTNIIGRDHLDLKTVRNMFYLFMLISAVLGALLVFNSNWIVGVLGMIGFYIGLFYSYGKYPLNSLPIAEALTGTASGFFISVIAFYLSILGVRPMTIELTAKMYLISLPLVIAMFNNLLSNNTCDLEEDINNNRKTLVYYIGKKNAVGLLKGLYLFTYLLLPILVIGKLAPATVLLLFIALPSGWKGLKIYTQRQDKKETFPIVLKTMALIMVGYPILYFVGTLLAGRF